jgi:predicted esterase
MSNPNDNAQTDRSLPAEIKLYYDLQPSQNSPAPLLIALHGYGANKRQMMREAQQMAPSRHYRGFINISENQRSLAVR